MAKISSRGGEPWALRKAKQEVTRGVRLATIAETRRRGYEVADDSLQDEYGNAWPVITVTNFDAILNDMEKEATDGPV